MTKRVKPTLDIPVIKSLEEADSTLARIAGLKRHIGLVEASMNEQVDAIKLQAANDAEPHKQQVAALEQSLVRFADYHKTELFTVKKSRDLTFGCLGFRQSSKLKLIKKMTWERVLQMLRDLNLKHCIRTKEEPDKEALKGLKPEQLQNLGCKVEQEDTFYYELAEMELSSGTGDAA